LHAKSGTTGLQLRYLLSQTTQTISCF